MTIHPLHQQSLVYFLALLPVLIGFEQLHTLPWDDSLSLGHNLIPYGLIAISLIAFAFIFKSHKSSDNPTDFISALHHYSDQTVGTIQDIRKWNNETQYTIRYLDRDFLLSDANRISGPHDIDSDEPVRFSTLNIGDSVGICYQANNPEDARFFEFHSNNGTTHSNTTVTLNGKVISSGQSDIDLEKILTEAMHQPPSDNVHISAEAAALKDKHVKAILKAIQDNH